LIPTIRYSGGSRSWLSGPAALVDAIARAAGLTSRDCVDPARRVIEHDDEAALVAAAHAAGYDVRPTCAVCGASRSGPCPYHQGGVR
jgi:hypothetical protein